MPNLFLGFPVSRAKFAEFAESVVTSFYESKEIFRESWFESLDGWGVYKTGSGNVVIDPLNIKIITGGTAGSIASILDRVDQYPYTLTWSKKRRFKLRARVDRFDDPTGQLYINTGQQGTNKRGFGFKFLNNKIQGYAQNGGAETTVDLITGLSPPYSRQEVYEAIFTPGTNIVFNIDGVEKGTLTTGLPTGTTDANYLFFIYVYCVNAVDHQIWTSYLKVAQEKVT